MNFKSIVPGQSYTAFASAIAYDGAEYCVARTGFTHNADFEKNTSIVLYRISPMKVPAVDKFVLYTSAIGADVRDPNITKHRLISNYAIIKYSEVTATARTSKIITLNLDTLEIVASFTIPGVGTDYFVWGNTLMTPSGKLLFASYRTDENKIQIWRSAQAFTTGTEVAGSTSSIVAELGETTDCEEPTLAYWKNRLVLIYRKSGAVSRISYTFDLEGATGWIATYPMSDSRYMYSPTTLAYSDGDTFPAAGTLGTDRKNLVLASSYDLHTWSTCAYLGDPRVSTMYGVGYPSLVDLGGEYSLIYFWESWWTGVIPTRLERRLLPKNLMDVGYDNTARASRIDMRNAAIPGFSDGVPLGDLAWNTTRYGAAALNYGIVCAFRKSIPIISVYLRLGGSTTTAAIEVYENSTLIATSNTASIATTTATAVQFVFASSLTMALGKEYKFKIINSGDVFLYTYRHNNKVRTRGEFPEFIVYDLIQADGITGGNVNDLVIPAFKYNV